MFNNPITMEIPMKNLLSTTLFGLALLAVCIPTATAQGLPDATAQTEGKSGEFSAERNAMRERCKANPQQCEEWKAKFRQQHREECKADPTKCREERHARQEEFCKANPQRCAEAKARREKRREECKADPAKCRAATGRRIDRK